MTEPTAAQKDYFTYGGVAGLGIALICLFQQLYIIDRSFIVALLFSISSIAGIVAFTAMMKLRKETGVLLITALSLLFLRQVAIALVAIKYGIVMFSLIQIIFFIYVMVITIIFFVNGHQRLLKALDLEKKREADYWKNVH